MTGHSNPPLPRIAPHRPARTSPGDPRGECPGDNGSIGPGRRGNLATSPAELPAAPIETREPMPTQMSGDPAGSEAQSRLADVGVLLLDAGLSVTDTRGALVRVAAAQSPRAGLEFIVLPTTVLVGGRQGAAPLVGGRAAAGDFSIVQTAASLRLLSSLESCEELIEDVGRRIAQIRKLGRPLAGLRWIAGSALIGIGLAILFRCPLWAIALSALTGALVGAISAAMNRVGAASAIVPFVATLVSTLTVGCAAAWLGLGPVPLFAVCAPIAILIPGATITNALLELTSADIVTGSARLIAGLVVLGFMTVGILAGSALTGLHVDPGSAALIGDVPLPPSASIGWSALPPAWAAWTGVGALACGVGVAFGAGPQLAAIGVCAMAATYALLEVLSPQVGSVVATGIAGATLFVASRLLERTRAAVPSAVSFQPAFLLLGPGTVGLVALTTLEPTSLSAAPLAFVSLSIGTKVGSVIADTDWLPLPRRARSAPSSLDRPDAAPHSVDPHHNHRPASNESEPSP